MTHQPAGDASRANDLGRDPSGTGSREPDPQAVPALSGFDPSRFEPRRYEGKPRWLPKSEKRLLRAVLDAVEERVALMSDREQTELLSGCLNVSPINCAWDEYAMAEIIWPFLSHDIAQGIETRSAETEGLSPEGESPVAASDAPKDQSHA